MPHTAGGSRTLGLGSGSLRGPLGEAVALPAAPAAGAWASGAACRGAGGDLGAGRRTGWGRRDVVEMSHR
jgi:hypothetical protein